MLGINLLRPIPGTGVFERPATEGRLLPPGDDHDAFRFSWGQEMLYHPEQMSLEEFIPSYTELTSKVSLPRAAPSSGRCVPPRYAWQC